MIMQTSTEDAIVQKTKDLCQAIIDLPQFQSIRGRIDSFMADEQAKTQYESVMEKGQALNQKQQFSMPISNEEIADFETHRETLIKNPVARGFIDAQEELHKIQSSVNQYVTKTMELGRVPQEEDFGSCGHGCGCHH